MTEAIVSSPSSAAIVITFIVATMCENRDMRRERERECERERGIRR